MLEALLLIGGAYLIGSLASAIIICKLMGLPDPRSVGSGNPGATNVLRSGGKKAAVLTLAGDVFKGWLPVMVGHLLGVSPEVLAAIAFAAFGGHLFPVFFGFRGGKGVATAFGASLGLSGCLGLAILLTWLATAALSRYSSLSALVSALLAPVYAWFLTGELAFVVSVGLCSLLLIWRHRGNLQRLMSGAEDKIGSGSQAKTEASPSPEE